MVNALQSPGFPGQAGRHGDVIGPDNLDGNLVTRLLVHGAVHV